MSPDDESFGLGALLDGFVQAGAAVSVLCLTQGEASTLGVSEGLGRVRAEELRQTAEEVGIGSAVLRDYLDAHLGEVASHMLVDEVLHELDARPADGLLVFGPSGITAHPEHVAATRAAVGAAERKHLPVVAWTLPTEVAQVLNREYTAGFIGHAHDEVDLVVRVTRERQRAASSCHASQSIPTSVLWRRLELLGDVEHLRHLRS